MRYSYTPTLGFFSAVTSASGEVLVSEARLRDAMERAAAQGLDLAEEIDKLLGRAWDEELETVPLRGRRSPGPVAARYRMIGAQNQAFVCGPEWSPGVSLSDRADPLRALAVMTNTIPSGHPGQKYSSSRP